jgi:hypothetical protein
MTSRSVASKAQTLRSGHRLGIPMMSITQSDLMPISAERSDAGLSQCERVIGMSQDVL